MKITVCEFPDESPRKDPAWTDLVRFLRTSPTDVVVLPEMPFCDWRMFMTKTIELAVWEAALAAHDATIARFAAPQTTLVLASRPGETTTGRLCALQLRGVRIQRHFHVIHHEARRVTASARAFMELMEHTGRVPPTNRRPA